MPAAQQDTGPAFQLPLHWGRGPSPPGRNPGLPEIAQLCCLPRSCCWLHGVSHGDSAAAWNVGRWPGRKFFLFKTTVVKRETEITACLRRGQELSQTSWNKRRLEIYARISSSTINISQQEKGREKEKKKRKRIIWISFLNIFSKKECPKTLGSWRLTAQSCPNSTHASLALLSFPIQNIPAHLRSLPGFNPNRPGIFWVCLFYWAMLLWRYFSDYLQFLQYFFLQLYSSSFF